MSNAEDHHDDADHQEDDDGADLGMDAQNSNSPNALADSRLITSTTARAMSTVAQVGMVGNQYWT